MPGVGVELLESAAYYHEMERWWVRLFLLMPDHLHALLAVPKGESLPKVVRMWKGYQTKRHGINWQVGFFDHRLRSDESEQQKADYIRMHPVRGGLGGESGRLAIFLAKRVGRVLRTSRNR
jgi:putative transposase